MPEINLRGGRIAIVDDQHYDYLNQFKWTWVVAIDASRHPGYALRWQRVNGQFLNIRMHDEVMRLNGIDSSEFIVDHRDGDGLNNRFSNLRRANQVNHSANTNKRKGGSSLYKGVSLLPSGKWRARIKINGQVHELGLYRLELDAAKAYDTKARELFGEFAKLNFP